jgi:RNA polymerase sigma-70 factor, ECF subfamily
LNHGGSGDFAKHFDSTVRRSKFPEKYRTVLILRDVQHLSITETSQVLGISEVNVKTRLSRARLQMRDMLAPGLMSEASSFQS